MQAALSPTNASAPGRGGRTGNAAGILLAEGGGVAHRAEVSLLIGTGA